MEEGIREGIADLFWGNVSKNGGEGLGFRPYHVVFSFFCGSGFVGLAFFDFLHVGLGALGGLGGAVARFPLFGFLSYSCEYSRLRLGPQ